MTLLAFAILAALILGAAAVGAWRQRDGVLAGLLGLTSVITVVTGAALQ